MTRDLALDGYGAHLLKMNSRGGTGEEAFEEEEEAAEKEEG